MRINIESVRKKEAAGSVKFDYTVEAAENGSYVSLLGATEVDLVRIRGEAAQKNGLVAADYEIEAGFLAECARCGRETRQIINVSGEKYIADKSGEDKDGGDFYVAETDGILELDDFIVEFLGVEVPYRYLCSEDCKGLCQNCGKDLNEGECNCQKTKKNPAFKVLDGFFKE